MITYRFKKEHRDENADFETSYAFKRQGPGMYQKKWFTLNKKATTIIEKEDHLEIQLEDWYIKADINDKFIEQTVSRRIDCENCEKEFLNYLENKYK